MPQNASIDATNYHQKLQKILLIVLCSTVVQMLSGKDLPSLLHSFHMAKLAEKKSVKRVGHVRIIHVQQVQLTSMTKK